MQSNILLVHNYYQIPGGEDTVFNNEKRLLEDNGHKVITYTRNNSELKNMSKFKKILIPFITIFNVKTYIDIKKIIKKENIDIIHVHNTLNLISPSVFYAAKSMKKPVVQTIHNFRMICPGATLYRNGNICEDCINKGYKCAIKNRCYRNSKIQTFALVLTTKIHKFTGIYKYVNYICLTEFNKKKLMTFKGINEKQIFVKPNFVNDSNIKFTPASKRLNQVIYVGRLDKLKGVDKLLESWKEIKDTKLVICGTGPLEEDVVNFIRINKSKNIIYKGFVNNKEALEMISKSKALILPTQWYEGFPMTIVESLSVGTPVIGSNIGNTGSIIKNNINGYKVDVNLTNLKNIVSKIDDDIYKKSLDYFNDNYNEKSNYKLLSKIYKRI